MKFNVNETALVLVDPQNEFLNEIGEGFKLAKDATTAPGFDAYKAVEINFGMLSSGSLTTEEVLQGLV